MKILFITNGFPPHRWAGTETYTAGIAKCLQKNTHSVQVLCVGNWEKGRDYYNGFADDYYDDIPVRRLNLNWIKAPDPSRYLYNNPVAGNYLSRYLGQIQPDVVHVTSCETLSASILHVVNQVSSPLVLSLTDFWFLCPRINLLRSSGDNCDGQTTSWDCLECQLRYTKTFRMANRILPNKRARLFLESISKIPQLTRQRGLRGLACDMGERKAFLHQSLSLPNYRITASHFVKDVFTSNGVSDPIKVQPYGHDLSWLSHYQGKTPSKEIRFGFIGQIIHIKGVHLLIHAARLLTDDLGEHFSISIYGDLAKSPKYSNQLTSLSAGLPNIQFCGTYLHEQTDEIFSNIDVLVVPSLWYDFPLIIYEAFASKTPVIATNLAGMAEAVSHEENGLLFECNNVPDLSRQLKRILDESNLLVRLKAGIPRVKQIEDEVTELENIYTHITRKP